MDILEQGACHPNTNGGRKLGVNFFPQNRVGVNAAIKVCKTCTIRERCLDYAIENGLEHGVWGGTSERGRKEIARQRGVSPMAPVAVSEL